MLWSEVFEEARARLDDTVEPFLWTNPDIIRYANQAEKDIARMTGVITDSSTATICQAVINTGAKLITVSPLIVEIHAAYCTGQPGIPLIKKSIHEMDDMIPGWRTTVGTPVLFIPEYEPSKVRLYPYYVSTLPIPETAIDTLNLEVSRLPKTPLTGVLLLTASPEVPELYHMCLVSGMLKYAFLKRDSETYNVQESRKYADMFKDDMSDIEIDSMVKAGPKILHVHLGTL